MTEPQTLDALMAGREPGSIRVKQEGWTEAEWFQPYYTTTRYEGQNATQWTYGLRQNGESACFVSRGCNWLVIPKTRTVKLYGAVFKWLDTSTYLVTGRLYQTLALARQELEADCGRKVVALTDQPLATVEVEE